MRSGSTWLETMLGALPDVTTEYELKWKPKYKPQDIHYVLDDSSISISQILTELPGSAAVAGSKFVFDNDDMSPDEFQTLTRKIGSDVRIIHLVRSLKSVFLSHRRGFFHHLNPKNSRPMGARLMASIKEASMENADDLFARDVSLLDCYEELRIYAQNDTRTALLAEYGNPYLQVNYDDVPSRFLEIAQFAGICVTPDMVVNVLDNPPVLKLPSIEPNKVVKNISSLEPMIDHLELSRMKLIKLITENAGDHLK